MSILTKTINKLIEEKNHEKSLNFLKYECKSKRHQDLFENIKKIKDRNIQDLFTAIIAELDYLEEYKAEKYGNGISNISQRISELENGGVHSKAFTQIFQRLAKLEKANNQNELSSMTASQAVKAGKK